MLFLALSIFFLSANCLAMETGYVSFNDQFAYIRASSLSPEWKAYHLRNAVVFGDIVSVKTLLLANAHPLALDAQNNCAVSLAIAHCREPQEMQESKRECLILFLENNNVKQFLNQTVGQLLLIDAIYKKNIGACIALCNHGVNIFGAPYDLMWAIFPELDPYLYHQCSYYRNWVDDYYKELNQEQNAYNWQDPEQNVLPEMPRYSEEDRPALAALGITLDCNEPPKPHQILKVSIDGDSAKLKKAHKKLMKIWHTDKFYSKEESVRHLAEEVTKIINAAYDYLLATEKQTPLKRLAIEDVPALSVHELLNRNPQIDTLANKELTSLEGLARFYGNRLVPAVIIRNNRLSELKFSSFAEVAMQVLVLKNNRITRIAPDAFVNTRFLIELFVSNNLINAQNLRNLKISGLTTLDISHNEIEKLEADTLAGIPHVTNLNLSYNKILKCSRDAFAGLRYLWKLDLTGNRLEDWRGADLSKLTQNQLKTYKINFKKNHPMKKKVQLHI